ncbi:hypothetical protein ET33_33535 [Paenibacillus tyrfis]|uniref:Uncharacterized protein n=1 Tax=Paenibacillus tyrfis TaxID=1501230 RepID=A0A081P7S8_9BACL|nr:hypothetical protein ET33_33535 [Paenibacillus tyrfis]
MKSLNPAIPVLPMGIFRYFWAVACVYIGASPNEDVFNSSAILSREFTIVKKNLFWGAILKKIDISKDGKYDSFVYI